MTDGNRSNSKMMRFFQERGFVPMQQHVPKEGPSAQSRLIQLVEGTLTMTRAFSYGLICEKGLLDRV